MGEGSARIRTSSFQGEGSLPRLHRIATFARGTSSKLLFLGNLAAWFGGRGGVFIKADTKKRRITEYLPPTPYLSFYEAMLDKNGDIWAGELQGGRLCVSVPSRAMD